MEKPQPQRRNIKTSEQLKRIKILQPKLRKTFAVSFTRTDKRGGRK